MLDESLTMNMVDDNVACAILDMLVQKNLKLGKGMFELVYGARDCVNGSYYFVIKDSSMLCKTYGGLNRAFAPISPIIFYDAYKLGPYACALSTMLQLSKDGITTIAFKHNKTMLFMRSNATIDELRVEYDLWSSII